jgi:ribonuclease HII
VVAAAVILDPRQPIEGLADSKRCRRAAASARRQIRAKALCVCIAEASVEEIDRLNILQATLLAMQRAVAGPAAAAAARAGGRQPLPVLPMPARPSCAATPGAGHLGRVDPGQGAPRPSVPNCTRHPHYGFDAHKGYPTAAHLEALRATAPAPRTGAASRRCAARWGRREGGHGRRDRHAATSARATTRCWCGCAGWRRTGGLPQDGQVWLEGEHLCSALRARGRAGGAGRAHRVGLSDPARCALAAGRPRWSCRTALFAASAR